MKPFIGYVNEWAHDGEVDADVTVCHEPKYQFIRKVLVTPLPAEIGAAPARRKPEASRPDTSTGDGRSVRNETTRAFLRGLIQAMIEQRASVERRHHEGVCFGCDESWPVYRYGSHGPTPDRLWHCVNCGLSEDSIGQ